MKRAFTQREKGMLLVLVILVLVVGYVKFFYEPNSDALTAAEERRTQAEDSIAIEQVRAQKLETMRAELKEYEDDGASSAEIPDYDNIENVMVQLDSIFAVAQEYSLTFDDVEQGDSLISRPIQVTFTAKNYTAAKQILAGLYGCRYRCVLTNISVSGKSSVQTDSPITVSLTATFYEKSGQ